MTHSISCSSSLGSSSSLPSCTTRKRKREEPYQAPIERLLHADALDLIFARATQNGQDGKTCCAIRAVCTTWHNLLDSRLFKICWARLTKEVLYPALADSIASIDGADANPMLTGESECDGPVPMAMDRPALVLDSTYFSRFAALTQDLREKGAPIPDSSDVIGFKASSYEEMHRGLDSSLEAIWTCIEQQIDFNGSPPPTDLKSIRTWLNAPANARTIARIAQLDLSRMNLTVLPTQIGRLSQLKWLNLSYNHLTSLPVTIGRLSQLIKLNLSQNQLRRLPKEIGRLSSLTQLYLQSNNLTSIPKEIGRLSWLTLLCLQHNNLTSIPKEIGCLSDLMEFYCSSNRLTHLPPEIGNLSQLRDLQLDDNLLLFTLKKDFQQVGDHHNFNFQKMADKFSACSNYTCRTPLASLCLLIHLGKEDHLLKSAFELLSDEMRQRIREAWTAISSSSQAEATIFSDRGSLVQAVITALQGKWQSLSKEQRYQTYHQVALLAGQPEKNTSWGKTHAEENMIRLIDAMELINKE